MTEPVHMGSVPSPDPTVLTTEALLREITAVTILLHTEVAALKEKVEIQLTERMHTLNERFKAQDLQFDLAERQRIEQKQDTKTAVDAALQAQKEAVREQVTASSLSIAKSETATGKQLEQLAGSFATAIAGANTAITDLKDRVVRMEALKVGSQEQRLEARQVSSATYAFIGIVITVVLAAITIVGVLTTIKK